MADETALLDALPKGDDGFVDWSLVSADDLPEPLDAEGDSDDEELEAELGPAEEPERGYDCVVFVAHLPVVPPEKHDKLLSVVRKIYSQIGTIRDGGLWMPVDPATQSTKGHAFVEFSSPAEAAAAAEQTDGYKLDKLHVFRVARLAALDRAAAVPDAFAPPEAKPAAGREELASWLGDVRGRDQFAVRFGDDTEVYWNDAQAKRPEEVYRRSFWTESYVQWSPRGHYLATVHRQGLALWGGPQFARLARMQHPGVQFLEFSPGERYVATCSVAEPAPGGAAQVDVTFFDTRTGRKLRTFAGGLDDFMLPGAAGGGGGGAGRGPGGGFSWPVFKWAGGEDRYLAKIGRNAISLYEAPDMQLLDKKSLKLEGCTDFAWSPSEALLAVYQPETNGGNTPARVSLWSIPSRREVRQKQLFSVCDARMYWHPGGDYLCVKVDRFTKTKKTTYTGFELFRTKERDVPMEVLELENKTEKIIAFAWEPQGHRFCVIHGEGARPDVSFYTMRADGGSKLRHLGTLKGKSANAAYWSPSGHHLVLAGLKGLNGQLEFFSADEMETLATAEHFMCTDVDWDPTGRYVATSVTAVHAMENGCNVWSFNGQLLYRLPRDRFYQLLWRPRPPSLLSAEQEREIMASLKKYSKQYDEADAQLSQQADSAQVAERAALMDGWLAWLRAKRQAVDSDEYRDALAALVGPPPLAAALAAASESVQVEEVIDIREEIISFAPQQQQQQQ